MTTLRAADPRIDFCIMSLQSAGIETDWEAFRTFVAANPDAAAIATKTDAIMRQSGFSPDEIDMLATSAADEVQTLVNVLNAGQESAIQPPATPATSATSIAPATTVSNVNPVNVGDPISLDEALMLQMVHQIRHGLTTYQTPIPDKYTLDNKGNAQGDVHNSTWVSIDQHAFTVGQIRGISGRDAVLAAIAVVSDTATPDQRRALAAWLDTNPNLPGETATYRWDTAGSVQHATDITNLRRRTIDPAALDLNLRTVRTRNR